VSKISDLIENKETISLLGKNARQTVVDKYSTEANLKKYINAFNNITNRL
jgi:glycosyltransferase involved in cell wall biosynthesis